MQKFADRFDGVTGSEIRKIFALLSDPEIISFAGGNPSPEAFPDDILAALSSDLLKKNGSWVLQYGETRGIPSLIGRLKDKNADIMRETDDLIMLTGSSQGIDFFTRAMLNEGDAMLVESPTFLGALQTFLLARADIKTVDLKEDGADLSELEEKIERYAPKFFYVIPTFQNPSGITTSAAKRRGIYEICKRHNVMILEDDPYGELRYSGLPEKSIKSYDDCGLVCRLSSFSKTISPGLRVGYAIAHSDVIQKFNLLKQGADVHTSNLSQALVSEFIDRGFYPEHIKNLCVQYKEHRDAMLCALDAYAPQGMTYTRPEGGLFIWATLPEGVDARRVFERCVENKVAFVPGSPFFADGGHENTLRLNFSMPGLPEIETGIKKMCGIIREFV